MELTLGSHHKAGGKILQRLLKYTVVVNIILLTEWHKNR